MLPVCEWELASPLLVMDKFCLLYQLSGLSTGCHVEEKLDAYFFSDQVWTLKIKEFVWIEDYLGQNFPNFL